MITIDSSFTRFGRGTTFASFCSNDDANTVGLRGINCCRSVPDDGEGGGNEQMSKMFEDSVWDEFCQSDDHIVPNPGAKRANNNPVLDDSHKKHRREVTSIFSNSGDRSAAGRVDQQREPKGFPSLSKRNTSLEKGSWSQVPSGMFTSASGTDSMKEATNLASDNAMPSSHGFKSNDTHSSGSENCANDTIVGCKITAIDNNSFSYPLADITQTNNNLDFFENTKDKESSELLYYGWPEIGNFEDVDRMFRSCDSTFGLGASNEDELGWLSSADNMGGCADVVKSDFMFPSPESNAVENISQNHDSTRRYSINESAMTSTPVRYKDSSWITENSDSYLSFVNGPAIADSKDGLITNEQWESQFTTEINDVQEKGLNGKIQPKISTNDLSKTSSSGMINKHKKQLKPQKQSVGKRKEHNSGNISFSYMSNLTDEAMQFPPGATSHQSFPYMQQQHQAFGADSYSYLQNPLSYVHSDSRHFSDQNSVIPRPPTIKSETNDPSSQVQASICEPGSKEQQVYFSGDKIENRSNTDGVFGPIPAELGSSNMQERSTRSSGLDHTSLEAASFRQLQLVMEQLDLRTKLCIRDSLYRLARSAEQRHNHTNLNGDERDASGTFMAEGTNNFMDIETDTNPIDRSIAHLLFHRPSESSTIPSAVHGSVTSPPIIEENLVICDETASELEKQR
ncbi:hypothetical protein BUALT_Bualt15G0071200 [Buddleja alternifolia]|uniref:Protein LNK1 n=1 Tax=Buddleja alternifolia TaxID=168488 RepID=A0AAV6WDK6_9LAMI|nr:hypothetical protein BUALT_Bualt15G0071200 [Buddleja alternifolia]